MRVLLFFAFILGFISHSHAQYGMTISYDKLNINSLSNQNLNGDKLLPTDYFNVAANYWFRLKNHRLEFFPEASYRQSMGGNIDDAKISRSQMGLNLNTSFYIFDFAGDCDCPTFSKDGEFFKKGFFLEISPGVFLDQNKVNGILTGIQNPGEEPSGFSNSDDQRISFKLGLGAGIDVGVSDFLTVTPFIRYDFHFGDQWGLMEIAQQGGRLASDESSPSNHGYLRIGVRTSLRPDYKRRWW